MTSAEWDSGSVVTASELLIVDSAGNVIGQWDTSGIRVFNPLTGTTFLIQPDASIRFKTSDPDEGNITTIDSAIDGAGATRRKNLLLSSGDLNNHGVAQLYLESATDNGASLPFPIFSAPLAAPAPGGSPNVPDVWHNVAFNTGWGNTGAPYDNCQYRMNALGQVEFRGHASCSVTDTAPSFIFTLPAAYRPAKDQSFGTATHPAADSTAATATNIVVQSSDGVVVNTSFGGTITPGPVSLAGIAYYPS